MAKAVLHSISVGGKTPTMANLFLLT